MLGYVKPSKPELRIKDYELYRGYYCSLCKALGKKYGVFARLFLSYDVTFFVVFVFGLINNRDVCFKGGRCPFNPTKKCNYTDIDNPEFDFAAAFTVIVTYFKIKDNISDGNIFKKIAYTLFLPFVIFKYKKAKRLFPEIDSIVGESITEQNKLEINHIESVDRAADPSGIALGKCFENFANSNGNKELFYRFGYCLGRFVYLIDAFDDREKDLKNKNYNVFNINGYTDEQISESIRMSINELIVCFEKIEFTRNKPIAENIVRLGLEEQLVNIISKKEGKVNE